MKEFHLEQSPGSIESNHEKKRAFLENKQKQNSSISIIEMGECH